MSVGRNQPLKPEKPKWKSDVPLTESQLRSKRDEFWDTAPAFDGRKEIWDALKAASYALETGDHSLAQAIVDGASISLPHGQYICILVYICCCTALSSFLGVTKISRVPSCFHNSKINSLFQLN